MRPATPELVASLAAQLGLESDYARKVFGVMLENLAVFEKKQAAYGPNNIGCFQEFGVLVRANDKMERLKNLHRNQTDPNEESIMDSWADLLNYAAIAIVCRRGEWK